MSALILSELSHRYISIFFMEMIDSGLIVFDSFAIAAVCHSMTLPLSITTSELIKVSKMILIVVFSCDSSFSDEIQSNKIYKTKSKMRSACARAKLRYSVLLNSFSEIYKLLSLNGFGSSRCWNTYT
jgi:hypothetical protein